MSNTDEILELKFDGNGINPGVVRPHEIAELIISFEKSLLITIKKQYPEIDTEELLFSFDIINDKSLDLGFIPKRIKEIVLSGYTAISICFSTGNFSDLDNEAIEHLKTFTKFSKRYNCIGYLNHNGKTLSSFNPNTEISINKPKIIRGEATIFGKVIDSGGEKPNVHIKINDEYVLIFKTSELNAQKLAAKLYQKVALNGIAKWDADTFKIEDFVLNDILEYSPGNTLSAINKLKSITSGFWDRFNTNDDINNQLLRD